MYHALDHWSGRHFAEQCERTGRRYPTLSLVNYTTSSAYTKLTASRLLIVIILFSCIVLLIDILAILLFLRDALKPGTFLTMNSFQTAFWGVALIMEFADIGKGGSHVGLGFGVFVLYVQSSRAIVCSTDTSQPQLLRTVHLLGHRVPSREGRSQTRPVRTGAQPIRGFCTCSGIISVQQRTRIPKYRIPLADATC